MGLLRPFAGTLLVEIKTASKHELFAAMNNAEIRAFDIQQIDELTVRGSIYRSDFAKLTCLLDKRNETFKIVNRNGMYWYFCEFLHRPVLLFGILFLLLFSAFLPTRILFVQVEGNQNIPPYQILEAAEDVGIRFGSSRLHVRSEKVKNALLLTIPQLQWVGVNTYGCTAIISVKERFVLDDHSHLEKIASIVANCDGVIESMTVTKGNPVCTVGQAVSEGQVLVSAYTDCGGILKATCADAEIFARTYHQKRSITPTDLMERADLYDAETRYSIRFGKKLIKLYKDSGISDISCVKIYTEKNLSLPGGYVLPVSIIKEEIRNTAVSPALSKQEENYTWLYDQTEIYLLEHLAAGKILSNIHSFQTADNAVYMTGKYICLESIGISRSEETDNYGKRS